MAELHTFDYKRENVLPLDPRLTAEDLSEKMRGDLQREVDLAVGSGPFAVVREKRLPPSRDPHDYCSVSAYYWPNPDTPDGLPWVPRDGRINPERQRGDNVQLAGMCLAVRTCCLGHLLLGDHRCAEKARELLDTWFLRADSQMNPHMRFGQAVPGVSDGNWWGLIDANLLVPMLDALERSRIDFDPRLREWFGQFGAWFLDSELGKAAASAPNNHAVWHLAQTVAYLSFGGRTDDAAQVLETRFERLLDQIAEDGSQPHELGRTLSYEYSVYNLMGFCTLGHQAKSLGAASSQSYAEALTRAARFMLPYAQGEPWRWPQFRALEPERLVGVFHWVDLLCGVPDLRAAADRLIEASSPSLGYRAALFRSR